MLLSSHPDAAQVVHSLRQNNTVLKHLETAAFNKLLPLLQISDIPKGYTLEHQGDEVMEQYFILEGILKRVVSNPEGKEMILRFAPEHEIDTSYAAYRLHTPIPYSILSVNKARVVRLGMEDWVDFLEDHAKVQSEFEQQVMKIMSDVMAHVITLHLLDAPGRVQRFMRKHGNLVNRIPKKELASYLNITPETLSRLKQRGIL